MSAGFLINTKMKADTKLTVMWCQIFDRKSTAPSSDIFLQPTAAAVDKIRNYEDLFFIRASLDRFRQRLTKFWKKAQLGIFFLYFAPHV